jgi:murein DD-endopeptidase MepM/ murein hydrolase activator NlpD
MVGLVLASLGFIYHDYRELKEQRARFAALQIESAEQQELIDSFQQRLAAIRTEVEGWRALRSRIWRPFGPDAESRGGTGGVGGGTALRLLEERPAPALTPMDELDRLAATVIEEGDGLRALERFLAKAGPVLASMPSRWPVRGPVNSDFGKRSSPWAGTGAEHHSGLDIGAPRGTPVLAPAPGTVVFAGNHYEYGITLIIDHGHDIKSLYGHLSRVDVAIGRQVSRGQVVALTGNTGRSSGPHLHYEIQVAGQAVNPRSYLWD